jgi:dTDP-4-amino-4,6-dideoxygalactose transaminase
LGNFTAFTQDVLKPIPFLSLSHQHSLIRSEVLAALTNVYDRNWFILGKELEDFETAYARSTNTAFCIGVGNGHDALFIALKACGIGPADEVIVPAHTFIATWLAVSKTGAKIIPVEPLPDTFNIDPKKLEQQLTKKTKAIIPVHLYGQSCDMTTISKIAKAGEIVVIEDNAQAHGAGWCGRPTGGLGDINATSFYPVKNLGAIGDGGALTTNNTTLATYSRQYRNYGFKEKNVGEEQGINSRLDEIQAAVLSVKLKYLKSWNDERKQLAASYLQRLNDVGDLLLPYTHPDADHVFHLFVIRTSRRDALREYLRAQHVETMIHYPIPPHLQQSYKDLGYKKGNYPITESIAKTCLSLPLWPGMVEEDIEYISDRIKKFF